MTRRGLIRFRMPSRGPFKTVKREIQKRGTGKRHNFRVAETRNAI